MFREVFIFLHFQENSSQDAEQSYITYKLQSQYAHNIAPVLFYHEKYFSVKIAELPHV